MFAVDGFQFGNGLFEFDGLRVAVFAFSRNDFVSKRIDPLGKLEAGLGKRGRVAIGFGHI